MKASHMLMRAGSIDELIWDDDSWIVLDVGFAQTGNRSSGLGIGSKEPIELTFADAKEDIIKYIQEARYPINLVIEAPLSIAFDAVGNPTGRQCEIRQGVGARYWYTGAAAIISIATLHLIREMNSRIDDAEVRLFEGFATFKSKGPSNHKADVEALRRVVRAEQGWVINSDEIAKKDTDRIESLFCILGLDTGIPHILVPW
jgi:hypothetical protein